MHSNSAFVMAVTVDRHFGNETVMVFRNLAIDDDFEDGVVVESGVAVHDDMAADVVLWVVEFQFLHTRVKTIIFSLHYVRALWKVKCFMCFGG